LHTTAIPSEVTRAYDLDGRLTTYPLGHTAQGGAVRTVAWDAVGRITAYTHVNGAGTTTTTNYIYSDQM
jgi:YD repeat-containing protein